MHCPSRTAAAVLACVLSSGCAAAAVVPKRPASDEELPRLRPNWSASLRVVLGSQLGAHGTGFVVSHEGHIVTARHVVENEDTVVISLKDEDGSPRMFVAQVVGVDKPHDLAVIKIPHRFADVALLSDEETKVGEGVYSVGYPYSFGPILIRGYVMRTGVHVAYRENGNVIIDVEGASLIHLQAGPGISGTAAFSQKDGRVLGLMGIYSVVGQATNLDIATMKVPPRIPAMTPGVLVPAKEIRKFLDRHRVPYRTR